MEGKTRLSFTFGEAPKADRVGPPALLRLVVLGDFSGRANRGVCEPLEARKAVALDIDNLDTVLAQFGPRLVLPDVGEGGTPLTLSFAGMDDFHPDHLLTKLGRASQLLKLRQELSSPSKAAAAMAALRDLLAKENPIAPPAGSGPEPASAAPESTESDDATLSRLLGGSPPTTSASTAPGRGKAPDLSGLFRQAAHGSAVPAPSAEQGALESLVNLQVQSAMRKVLHDPSFQRLESNWRSLEFLVRRAGGDERVKLLALDCTKNEVASDLPGLARLAVRSAEGGTWGAWVGLFRFGPVEADFTLLTQIATLAGHLHAPFFAEGDPALAGCDSFAKHPYPEDWRPLEGSPRDLMDALQRLPEAKWLGLATPRFLLRLPYGKGSQETESFGFEEMSSPPVHSDYLWGNPGIIIAALLADAFLEHGWGMDLHGAGVVGELPMHRYHDEGEKVMKPCAEVWLSDRAGEALMSRGLIPVLSVKNSDSVQVYKLRSVAKEPALVAGKWSGGH